MTASEAVGCAFEPRRAHFGSLRFGVLITAFESVPDDLGRLTSMKYWAFLSYSHRDNRKNGNAWADWLHEAIENFHVPKELLGRPTRNQEPIPERMYPSFQDEKELPTTADLGTAIEQALDESRYLLVICSPRSAQSVYVNQEVLHFKRLDRANQILAIIVDGEPNASDPHKNLDPALECFAPALRHRLGPDGNLDLTTRAEPIAADVRNPDGTEASLGDPNHRGVLEREKLRIFAGLLGVGFDDLVHRDRDRQLREARVRARRLRRLAIVFAALALGATVAGIIAFNQKQQAQQQRRLATERKEEAQKRLAEVYAERADAAYAGRDSARQAVFLAHARLLDPKIAPPSLVDDLSRRSAGVIWSVAFATPLNSLVLHPTERSIFVASAAGWFAQLETASGREIRRFNGPGGAVLDIAISPDGSLVAAGNADGVVRVWDLASGRVLKELSEHRRFVTSVCFSRDGQHLVSTSDDRTAVVWSVVEGKPLVRLPDHGEGVSGAAFNPSGDAVVTVADDGLVRVWRTSDGSPIAMLAGHDEDVAAVDFFPDGTAFITAGGDGILRVWDTTKPHLLHSLRGHEASVSDIAVTPKGDMIVSVGADKTIRIWDTQSREERCRLSGHTDWIKGVRPILGGAYVVSCAVDGRVCLWAMPFDDDARELRGHNSVVRRAAFSLQGETAYTCGDDQTIRHWDVRTGNQVGLLAGHEGSVTAVKPAPDGRTVLSASHDETLRLWDVREQKEIGRLFGHTSLVWGAALSSDGNWAISASADHTVRLWHLATRQPTRIFAEHKDVVNTVAFSADGTLAASGANDGITLVWEVESGRVIRRIGSDKGRVSVVAFASHAFELLTATWDGDVRLWDLGREGSPPRVLPAGASGCDAAGYLGGEYVVGGGRDGTLRVWDATSGVELRRIPAHVGRIYGLATSPDGKQVLTCGLAGRVRLWDLHIRRDENLRAEDQAASEKLVRDVESRTGLSLVGGKITLSAPGPIASAKQEESAEHPRRRLLFERLQPAPAGAFP